LKAGALSLFGVLREMKPGEKVGELKNRKNLQFTFLVTIHQGNHEKKYTLGM
jgi:hypothetical protein